MAQKFNTNQLIYEYLKGDSKANVTVSKLPPRIQRQVVTKAVQEITGGIGRNVAITEGSILDQSLYANEKSPHEVPNTKMAESHSLQINDILFNNVPVTQIGIQYQTHSFKSNSIRSQGPVKTKSGRSIISIQLQLVFVGLESINKELRRLIAQARILPIWYINNDYIRAHVYPEENQYKPGKAIAVVLNAMSISVHPEAIDTLIASLSLEVFNWEVYSKDFTYWTSSEKNKAIPTSNPINSSTFKLYWDSIISGYSNIDNFITDSYQSEAKSQSTYKTGKTENSSSPIKLYKTENSYNFVPISDFNSDDVLSITYDSYQPIPTNVLEMLLAIKPASPEDKIAAIQDAVSKKQTNREKTEAAIGPVVSNVQIYAYKELYNLITAKKILEFAKTPLFLNKPYFNDVNNREATDYYDCSSFVYNVLRRFGLEFGTYTGSQYHNISKGNPRLDSFDDLYLMRRTFESSHYEKAKDLAGCLIFCFKDPPSDPKKLQALKEYNRIYTIDNRVRQIGHVGFLVPYSKDKLKILHAYSSGVKETSASTLRGYNYFEIYSIPGVDHSEKGKGEISTLDIKRQQNVKENIKQFVSKLTAPQFEGLNKAQRQTRGDASLKLYEGSLQYGKRLVGALNAWLTKNKQWKLEWLRNGTLLLSKKNTLVLNNKALYHSAENKLSNSGPVLEHIIVNVNNTFARIPMNGHEFVTHQYLGGGDCDVVVQLKSVGLQFVAQLQTIRKYTESAARIYRYLDDVGTIELKNPIIQLSGSKKFIIESLETKTVPEHPDLYDIAIRFSEMRNNPRDSEAFKQEFVENSNVRDQIIKKLIALPTKDIFQNFEGLYTFHSSFAPDYMYSFDGTSRYQNRVIVGKKSVLLQIPKTIYSHLSYLNVSGDDADRKLLFNIISKSEQNLKDVSEVKNITKQQLIRSLITGILAQYLGHAEPLANILGMSFSELQKSGNDQKHPLYGYGALDKVIINSIQVGGFRLVKIQGTVVGKESVLVRFGFDENNPNPIETYPYVSSQVNKIFSDLVIDRKVLVDIPWKSSSIIINAIETWNEMLEGAKGLLSAGVSLYQMMTGQEGLKVFGLQTQQLLMSIEGSQIGKVPEFFKDALKNHTTVTNVGSFFGFNANYLIQTSPIFELRELQAKARFALIGLTSQFRAAMIRLSQIAYTHLKYTDTFADLVKMSGADDTLFLGLPAYQDIPVPYVDYRSNPEVAKQLSLHNKSPVRFLNPDFYFFNQGDYQEHDAVRITSAIDRATKTMSANFILSNAFGIIPSPNEPLVGPIARTGPYLPPGWKAGEINYRNLPETIDQYYFPMVMGRNVSKGLVGAEGSKQTMGVNGGTPAQSNPSKDAIALAIRNGKNVFNPALDYVAFGPLGGIESRLATVIDRRPDEALKFYVASAAKENSSPFRMRRAMPAIKLYFIEDDTSGFGGRDPSSFIRSYDDFFSYRAIKEVKMISSRKFPASHLIIRLSNLYGNLDGLQFSNPSDSSYNYVGKTTDQVQESISFEKQNTPEENPFTRFILKEGIRVQFRGGFDNNPEFLPIVFNGQIVQINQESGDEVVIVCQDFGTQLVADIKGQEKGVLNHRWIDTFELLSFLITQPEMTYFGRWGLDVAKSLGESKSTGGWEKVFKFLEDPRDDNLFCPSREQMIMHFSDEKGGMFSNLFNNLKYLFTLSTTVGTGEDKIKVNPVGEIAGKKLYAITSPSIVVSSSAGGTEAKTATTLTFGTLEYTLGDVAYQGLDYSIYRQTIWDIFKEMELRHPGWIGHPVVYGNRMTMFFGLPSQPYWFRPPSPHESTEIHKQNKAVQDNLKKNNIYKKVTQELAKSNTVTSRAVTSAKYYAWEALAWADWIVTVASIWTSFKTGGLSLGLLGAKEGVKITVKQILKRVAIGGAIAYGNYQAVGDSSWTALGLNVLLGGAIARSGSIAIASSLNKYSKITKIAAGVAVGVAGVTAVGTSAYTNFFDNTAAYQLMQQSIFQRAAAGILKDHIGGRLKPFRDHHIVTSKHNIVANQIKSSVHNIYNAVTLEYTDNEKTKLAKGDQIFGQSKAVKTLKGSHRIYDKDLRLGFFSYPNCRGSWMADRYCQGLLLRHLKDAYQGQLVVLGDFTLKPYDRVLIEDDYLGMYGQIEIEQVVHTVSPELGFITEITPDLVMYGNNIVDMPYDNFLSMYKAYRKMSWNDTIESVLKNDTTKFYKELQLKRTAAGGLKSGNAPGIAAARALNSIPTLFMMTFLGAGFGAGVALGSGKVATVSATTSASLGTTGLATVTGAIGNADNINEGSRDGVLNDVFSYIGYKLFGSMATKYYEWTLEKQPIIFEPLYINGKPMLPVIDMDKVSMLQYLNDEFIPIIGNLARGLDVLQESGRMFIHGDLSNKIAALD